MSLLHLLPLAAEAHVGSPDIYLDGEAGPYKLFVTVRPPVVIPGVAAIEVRTETAGVRELSATPLPMTGPGLKFAPTADRLKQSSDDRQFFTGSVWMMAPGSWQVKLSATGDRGAGVLAVPLPSAATTTKRMERGLGSVLLLMTTFLVFGAVAMSGAAVREATLPAGVEPDERGRRRGWKTMAVAFIVIGAILWFGKQWWNTEATSYANNIYKPLQMTPSLNNGTLTLTLHDPGWLNDPRSVLVLPTARSVDDLVRDHDHLMHLYLIREGGQDVIYHLHPNLVNGGTFRLALPDMPAGEYKLYADIVHRNGFPETLVSSIRLNAIQGRPLTDDDASATAPAWQNSAPVSTDWKLPDGFQMKWCDVPKHLKARQPIAFRFELLDAEGRPPQDMALYMGMLGHAAFVKTDGTVFAHIHPNGSVSMAAYMKAQEESSGPADAEMAAMNMPDMDHTAAAATHLPNTVGFPYGLPTTGRYRIFVQMKHGATVETGVFDAVAE